MDRLRFNIPHKFDDELDTYIKYCINSYLTRSTESAQDVALEIHRKFDKDESYPEGYADMMEDILIFMSKYVPFDHPAQSRLVELVKAVRELPHQADEPPWSQFLSSGLELDCKINDPTNDIGRKQWRNFNAFPARLTRDIESCKCSGLAIFAFEKALEEPKSDLVRYPMDLNIVFDWLSLAGARLVESKAKNGGKSTLWTAEPGFSQPRWQFWKKRLHEIAESAEYDDGVRERALQSFQCLDDLICK